MEYANHLLNNNTKIIAIALTGSSVGGYSGIGDVDIIKSKNIIIHSKTNFVDTRIVTYKGREPIFR